MLDNVTPSEHTHSISDIEGLQETLDNIPSNIGEIEIKDVKSLQSILDNKAGIIHRHSIDDINELRTYLDSKSNINHTHSINNIANLQDTLDNKANIEHKHNIDDVNNLKTALDNKSDINHVHSIDEIIDLNDTLNNKADVNHKHKWSEITEKPTSLPANIDKAVSQTHEHPNKDVIDFLGGDGTVLTYKGVPVIDGFRSVYNIEERDNIPLSERKEGMLCLTLEDGSLYYLKGGIDNAFWEIFSVAQGGATSASSLHYSPTGNLSSNNVQSAIDELENKKAETANVYTKVEVDNKIENHTYSYEDLEDKPDLSQLHSHSNMGTLEKFSEVQGELSWNGKTLGNMISNIYDSDGDGLVDKAATLHGLQATIEQLNYSVGLTGNIQQQINAISTGTVFKGEYPTFNDMVTSIGIPEKGYWVFIEQDETKGNARTQYYHDGEDWIYGGGAAQIGEATETTVGGIALAGVLSNPNSTAKNPLLNSTGVSPGLYKSPTIVVEEDGRISYAEEGDMAFINDTGTSEKETWSSQKIFDELNAKSARNHTHPQLHDSNMLGNVPLDTNTLSDKRVITYNAVTGKAEWTEPQGGKVYVGSRVISGDFKLVAGSNISLFIDEAAKTITINSTYHGGGGGGVPTLTEITHTFKVKAGESVRLDLDAAFNKYDIRTVSLSNTENAVMDIAIFDQAENGRRIYLSNKETEIYDIVNVPCHDKDETQKIHLLVTNHSAVDTTTSIVITTTNLI